MQINLKDMEYADKVTKSVLFVIDAIKRRREPGLIHDKDIAARLGISPQSLHYWRSKERAVTVDQLCAVIYVFDANPVFLTKQEGSPWGEAEMAIKIAALEKRLNNVEAVLDINQEKEKKKKK